MRRVPQQQYSNPHVRRERDPRAARRQTILLACCIVLAAGFVFTRRTDRERLGGARDRTAAERSRLRRHGERRDCLATLGEGG